MGLPGRFEYNAFGDHVGAGGAEFYLLEHLSALGFPGRRYLRPECDRRRTVPRFLTLEAGAGQHQTTGVSQSDPLGDKGRDLGRWNAEAGFREAKFGAPCNDGDIANAAQAQSTTNSRAFNQYNHSLRLFIEFDHQVAERAIASCNVFFGWFTALQARLEPFDVTARAEYVALASYDQCA